MAYDDNEVRDVAAALAIGAIYTQNLTNMSLEQMAVEAYKIGDAMLAERKKRDTK